MELEGDAGIATITRVHFEQAMATARKSVTSTDLSKYEQFRGKFDPSYV